ncbi:hypothetical protein ACK34S_20785, partial [Aeromonas hydrophila]|uniref:hypothetical protein n=1 Tax=Aeromonas hydrophila TaxID=644 RepID=UPI00398669DA
MDAAEYWFMPCNDGGKPPNMVSYDAKPESKFKRKSEIDQVIDLNTSRIGSHAISSYPSSHKKGYVPITCCMGRPSASCKQREIF